MSTRGTSRRNFLLESAAGLSGAWVAANYAGILAAEDYVLEAAQSGKPVSFQFFTPEQAVEIEAMAAQIIPTDESPGAREARVINFIDRALSTFAKNSQGHTPKASPISMRRPSRRSRAPRNSPRSPRRSRFR